MNKNDGHAHRFIQVATVKHLNIISSLFLLIFFGGDKEFEERSSLRETEC